MEIKDTKLKMFLINQVNIRSIVPITIASPKTSCAFKLPLSSQICNPLMVQCRNDLGNLDAIKNRAELEHIKQEEKKS